MESTALDMLEWNLDLVMVIEVQGTMLELLNQLDGFEHLTKSNAGTDSAVNLWMASPPSSDDLSSESLMESHTRSVDPLLNSYSDYEDRVYVLPKLLVLLGVPESHGFLHHYPMMGGWSWNQ
ncbi:WD repeat-containing protein DWA2 [Camellia lanceoleosa]|uniref:WD repeat-containing protein DWA2 n=1 Tax=Camellia lanceoleosa TaxID=1840588 RepID=A0ACC0GBR9_9ERIC|nr:WD repeat-containing protein DWA2 [Camellia lanceoleosa]